jgi:hypothetical protein
MKTLIAQKYLWFMLLLIIVLLSGCARNENIEQCLTGYRYGFFGGLWHGFIAPFDFIGMLFKKLPCMHKTITEVSMHSVSFWEAEDGDFSGAKELEG